MEGKKLVRLIKLPLLSLFLLLILTPPTSTAAVGRKVGGRKEVKGVKSNQEIQELGKYCVREYNKNLHSEAELLSFSEVVESEMQVVSGIKYFLKISAANGVRGYYDAVVVVKPWAVKPKEVLKFAHSSPLPDITRIKPYSQKSSDSAPRSSLTRLEPYSQKSSESAPKSDPII